MQTPEKPAISPAATPLPTLETLLPAIGHPVRFRMLRALAAGEPLTIAELAAAAGCSYQSGVKHLVTLREAGAVVQGRGWLYQVPAAYRPVAGQIDYGHCLLRFDA